MGQVQGTLHGIIVTIDGPAGAGKTTISKLLARRLGYRYLDTGALYRAVAVAAMDQEVASDNATQLAALCRTLQVDLVALDDQLHVFLNQEDVTCRLRTPEISMMASAVSAQPVVRSFLLDTQRALGKQKSVVAEGRDMGTVVFPQAEAKFFLSADINIRAKRRYEELKTVSGNGPSLSVVEKDMAERDLNDSTRQVAPLQAAPDAVHVDSTRMTPEEVVDFMMAHIAQLNCTTY